jgi:hypothetical protein
MKKPDRPGRGGDGAERFELIFRLRRRQSLDNGNASRRARADNRADRNIERIRRFHRIGQPKENLAPAILFEMQAIGRRAAGHRAA